MEKQDTSQTPPNYELWYRPPGASEHVILHEVLDELYEKIKKLEKQVNEFT
jgi:hypothetical protein